MFIKILAVNNVKKKDLPGFIKPKAFPFFFIVTYSIANEVIEHSIRK